LVSLKRHGRLAHIAHYRYNASAHQGIATLQHLKKQKRNCQSLHRCLVYFTSFNRKSTREFKIN
jgi:hypothetical protein